MDVDESKVSVELPARPFNIGLTWILNVDGAFNSYGSEAGLILMNSEEIVTEYTLRFLFKVTNNQSKYEVLLAKLRLAKELKV